MAIGIPRREFGWWDMFVHPGDDPRADGGCDNDEPSVLLGFLSDRRLTLEIKSAGLNAQHLGHADLIRERIDGRVGQ